jgi:hypothetical protein
MRGFDDLDWIKDRLVDAFEQIQQDNKADALLAKHFPEVGFLPRASEVIADQVARDLLRELARVLYHVRQYHENSPNGAQELDWDAIGHTVAYAAIRKAWEALNVAFKDARRERAA